MKTTKRMQTSGLAPTSVGAFVLTAMFLGALITGSDAWAFGRRHSDEEALPSPTQPAATPIPAVAPPGKKVIDLKAISDVKIELPDQVVHDFGPDFHARLVTRLSQTGKYIVSQDDSSSANGLLQRLMSTPEIPEYQWNGTSVPAASLEISVESMGFQTGSRGERMFYGFNDRMHNAFNSGIEKEEFPIRGEFGDPSWFDRAFDQKGSDEMGSRVGLDLGDGFDIDVLFAYLRVKWARYRSDLQLKLTFRSGVSNATEVKNLHVSGEGYFYDVAAGYYGYSAGVVVARRDAMLQAFNKALDGTLNTIDASLSAYPYAARVDGILPDGTVLIGTGQGAGMPEGSLYRVARENIAIRVRKSVPSGSIGEVVHGNASDLANGMLLVGISSLSQLGPDAGGIAALSRSVAAESASQITSSNSRIDLPWTNIPRTNLDGTLTDISRAEALARSIVSILMLPYRVWRYQHYDQPYHKLADGESDVQDDSAAPAADQKAEDWAAKAKTQPWAHQIGLDHAQDMKGEGPLVALIDSGMDYNHPVIHEALWLNPSPSTDSRGRQDRYGWDYISDDSHPYDDGYHGTEMASAVLAVAPQAKILPLKIFNPWGITRSAAIYEAFRYAVDHGAKIILCPWATRRPSQAIEQGVAYAQAQGVLVVTAAGDLAKNLDAEATYPAALSRKYANVVAVAAIDDQDQLVYEKNKDKVSGSSYSSALLRFAAPGKGIRVADPRNHVSQVTSTGVAASQVAGALVRLGSLMPVGAAPMDWLKQLESDADEVPGLKGKVQKGRRLRIK